MASVTEHLKRWLEAGVLDAETASRIEAYEHSQRVGRPAEERPGALEAVLYLGLVVLGVGVFSLFAQQWDEMESWARVAAIGVPTALLLGAGAALRFSEHPQLERGSQAAFLVAVWLFAGLVAVFINEYEPGMAFEDDREGLLTVATSTFMLSVILWVLSPRTLQLLSLAGAGFFLGMAIGNWPDDFSQVLAGMTILLIGAIGIGLAEAGLLTPAGSARVLFAVLVIIGPFQAGVGDDGPVPFELLTAAVAAGTIALGVQRGSFMLVLVGVAGAFLFLVSSIFEHFEEEIGAPMALIISGALVIGGVILLGVFRNEIQERRDMA